MTGWLADRFGLRELFIVSTAGFVVASMACGFATSLEEMILFRVLQGMFGAALVPLSQTVLLDINPKEEHGRAMAIWGAGIMVGPIIGPTLGGWLTETFNWRYVFFVNLPVGVAGARRPDRLPAEVAAAARAASTSSASPCCRSPSARCS